MAKYSSSPDSYVYPGTDVLINKVGLKDARALEKAEANYYAVASFELTNSPIKGNYDFKHLQQIHARLFGDLYDWAGKPRTVDISKGTSRFANHQFIESSANHLLRQLQKENHLKGLDADKISERAAHYLGEFNAVHPFREGNGRATRHFVGQLVKEAGFVIQWENITQKQMTQAAIKSFHGDSSELAELIKDNLKILAAKKSIRELLKEKDSQELRGQANATTESKCRKR